MAYCLADIMDIRIQVMKIGVRCLHRFVREKLSLSFETCCNYTVFQSLNLDQTFESCAKEPELVRLTTRYRMCGFVWCLCRDRSSNQVN